MMVLLQAEVVAANLLITLNKWRLKCNAGNNKFCIKLYCCFTMTPPSTYIICQPDKQKTEKYHINSVYRNLAKDSNTGRKHKHSERNFTLSSTKGTFLTKYTTLHENTGKASMETFSYSSHTLHLHAPGLSLGIVCSKKTEANKWKTFR